MLQGKRMKFRRSENILICLATAMSKKWILDYFYYFTSDISNITYKSSTITLEKIAKM